MSFLGTSNLNMLLPTCINPFNSSRISQAAYELSLGNEIFRTNNPSGTKEILDDKKSQIVIDPGQFALLLTDEIVTIPDNILAFISIKFSQKKKGLINVSGFHVDPGFSGKIKFSVYNAGPSPIILDKGEPYFLIWFSELNGITIPYNGTHGNLNIMAEDVNVLHGDLASPNELAKRIQSNKDDFARLLIVFTFLITIGGAILAKLYTDNKTYETGYKLRIVEESLSSRVDSLVKQKTDSVIQNKVDLAFAKRDSIYPKSLPNTGKKTIGKLK